MDNKVWFEAAKSGDLTKIKEMIQKGININVKDEEKNTSLIIAAREGQLEIVKFLIGVNYKEVFDLILEWNRTNHNLSEQYIKQWENCWKSVNINEVNKNGETALILATKGQFCEIVKVLINAGADVNAVTNYTYHVNYTEGGNSALIIAVKNGNVNLSRWLIEAKADVNVMDNYGDTPLIIAAKYRYLNIVKLLIDAGAESSLMNRYGQTIWSFAEKKDNKGILSLLERARDKNK
ncbi:ankyrin [Anaeromyces robustus]|uniref:Ankyrin n=1 Tax=Anaeromyces robustus TaxID=1754192 RepID=A0A1Y1XBJ1_9FUNG|nr:ankyrin [Anaeromyces robustus]|eukprot:ORX83130.1 ankyrin [Anaeromyces robustus]